MAEIHGTTPAPQTPHVGSRGEASRERQRIRRLAAAGICIRCKQPHDKGTQRCEACTALAVRGNVRARREARRGGSCAKCKRAWVGETKNCPDCNVANRAKWNGRAGTDFCVRCAGPRDGRQKACSACLSLMRVLADKRRTAALAAGNCQQCHKPRQEAASFCNTCILKTAARRWLGHSRLWRDLGALFEAQGGRCAYTGEALVLGDNASIDHRIPRSRGGPNTLANVQWVTWTVNRVKTDLTHDEFLSLCSKVAYREPQQSLLL